LGEAAIKTSLMLKADDGDIDQGTFVLTLVPPLGLAKDHRPRDLVFLLDRSGSMGGWKMVAASRALARMVDTLTDRDRFAVYAFDDRVETPPGLGAKGLIPATNRNRFRAVEFLARIEARGGTEMAQPLDRAVNELATQDPERDRILVLVTDGQVGNEDQILRNLGDRVQSIRIFTLGIDRAVNEGFLKRLAALGGGWCEFVEGEDRLDEVLNQVHRRIGMAVLTGLRLKPAGLRLDAESVVPARLPDLFAGAPLCVMGRYHGSANVSIALQAEGASGSAWSETVQASSSLISALSCVWARGHIRELEDRYVLGHRELEKQIVDTSLRFNVLCRFTAFVAVDKSEVVNAGGQLHQITQPVEAPQGWTMLDRTRSLSAYARCGAAGDSVESESVDSMLQEFTDTDLTSTMRGGPIMGTPAYMAPPEAGRSTPASAPPPSGFAKARKGKITGMLGRLLRHGQGTAPNLASYRQRVGALLADLKNSVPSDQPARLAALQILAGKLATLIADLTSIGASSTELRPLKKLLLQLQKFLAKKGANEAEVLEGWQKCEQVLHDFAAVTPEGEAPNTERREGFWK
jgi:Ca-activated chloride channel family protein